MFILTALSLRVETVGQSTVNQFFVCVHLGWP
jgi:hypothetical protein